MVNLDMANLYIAKITFIIKEIIIITIMITFKEINYFNIINHILVISFKVISNFIDYKIIIKANNIVIINLDFNLVLLIQLLSFMGVKGVKCSPCLYFL